MDQLDVCDPQGVHGCVRGAEALARTCAGPCASLAETLPTPRAWCVARNIPSPSPPPAPRARACSYSFNNSALLRN
jgi:hypothetical protein